MNLTTYFTGWVTTKFLKTLAWITIPLFLVVQCNRGCGSEPQPVSSTFDYTAIATSFHRVDTIPVDSIAATEDLKEILPSEMIEFAKDHSSLFAKYLSNKYRISNGYVEKIDSTE